MMKKITLFTGLGLGAPMLALAQDAGPITDLIDVLATVIEVALPVIIGLAVLLFLWGLLKYITSSDDAEAQKSARSIMIWGIIIVFVMVSVWGLVNLLGDVFGLESEVIPPAPGIPS